MQALYLKNIVQGRPCGLLWGKVQMFLRRKLCMKRFARHAKIKLASSKPMSKIKHITATKSRHFLGLEAYLWYYKSNIKEINMPAPAALLAIPAVIGKIGAGIAVAGKAAIGGIAIAGKAVAAGAAKLGAGALKVGGLAAGKLALKGGAAAKVGGAAIGKTAAVGKGAVKSGAIVGKTTAKGKAGILKSGKKKFTLRRAIADLIMTPGGRRRKRDEQQTRTAQNGSTIHVHIDNSKVEVHNHQQQLTPEQLTAIQRANQRQAA